GYDFMTVDAARGALDEFVEHELGRLVGPRRRRGEHHKKSREKCGKRHGRRPPAAPRTGATPAAPDRVRHAPYASAGRHRPRQRVHRAPIANRWTLLSTGIAPKESRS